MASDESFDLYTCEVCFENMMDKNPRLLLCLHSFCSECLEKLMKHGSILCPTCREKTIVPNKDIKMLKGNFMLQKVKEHLDKMHNSSKSLCQLSCSEPADVKCQECSQLLCNDCIHKHNEVKKFRDHKLQRLCKKHQDGILTNFCMKCTEPACANCVINEHLEHEHDVETYDEGIEKLNDELEGYETKLDVMTTAADKLEKEHEIKTSEMKESISTVKDIERHYLRKLEEVQETIRVLEESVKESEIIAEKYKESVEEWRRSKQLIPKQLEEIQKGDFTNYRNLKTKLDKILEAKLNAVKYEPPVIEIEDPRMRTLPHLTTDENKKLEVYLPEPTFTKEIRCPNNGKWDQPWSISSLDNDCVLICDWCKPYITCAYSSDKPTTTIPAVHGNVRDACVSQGYLYTAYDKCISKRAYNNGNTGAEDMVKPGIRNIHSMVVNKNNVYLLSKSEKRIIEFDFNTNTAREVVNDLLQPINLNLICHDERVMFGVSCHRMHSIKVYDENWQWLFTLGGPRAGDQDGQLSYPWGVTCTAEGILVADQCNQRITQFSFDGSIMKHILTRKELAYPLGITFHSQHLWMTQKDPYTVKCFQICN